MPTEQIKQDVSKPIYFIYYETAPLFENNSGCPVNFNILR